MIYPQPKAAFQDKPRIKTLDSLRGLAALTVVFAHCFDNLSQNMAFDRSPLYIVKSAHEAVIFFFLLSGYVLTYQYERKTFKYREFILLRICRIYLPYITAMVFCYIIYLTFRPTYVDGTFLGSFWSVPLGPSLIINHFILIGNFNTDAFNPVIWSLVHELRVGLIFPVLLLIIRQRPSVAVSITSVIFICGAVLVVLNVNPSQGFLNSYTYTLFYFPIFIAGGLLVKHQAALVTWYPQLKLWQKTLSVIFAVSLYTYAHNAPFILRSLHIPSLLNYSFALMDLLTTIAAFCLIIIALCAAGKGTFLDNKVPLFLGKISYSLYLVHLPILIFTYKELHDECSIFVIFFVAIAVSLIISTIFNFLVERNAVKLGKQLTAKYNPPPQTATVI